MNETASVQVEHHALQAHLDAIGTAADSIGEISAEETRGRVENIYDFSVRHLRPHMRAEDEVLYPTLDRLLRTPTATAALRRDHSAIDSLVQELASLRHEIRDRDPDRELVHSLRRTLYGLHLLLTLHFAKENELYFPLLDKRLDAASAEDLAKRMREVELQEA